MKNKISLMSAEDAGNLNCPYKLGNNEVTDMRCDPESCMAWTEVHGESSREDHSGAALLIQKWARGLGVKSWRSGGPGSMGYWNMSDAGYCKRLWPSVDVLNAGDYIEF